MASPKPSPMHLPRLLPALLLGAPLFGQVPEFFPSEAAFLKEVGEGQMDPQLDLHLLQYATDPRWSLEWMNQRGFRSGLTGIWGSTTARRLFTDMGIALNLDTGKGLTLRYDRREYADGRFELRQERVEFWWKSGTGVGMAVGGWPSPRKQKASFGLGFRVGEPAGNACLELHVVDEGFFWNQKSEGTLRFNRHPVRLLLDGHAAVGAWVMGGSLDLGFRYSVEDSATNQGMEGHQRHGTLLGESRGSRGALGGGVAWAARYVDQRGTGYFLDRRFLRASIHGRLELTVPTWHGQLAVVRQREVFGAPLHGRGDYRMDALVLSLEAGWKLNENIELRPGCMSSPSRMERRSESVQPLASLPPEDFRGYTDKLHLRALWTFKRDMSLELLLSHTLSGSRFGGASVKARFLF